ncbi:MAG TPA: glycosyltransferase family 2 protein [Chitinophagaceae bacterium]|jgi:glycosyltransferase involved in cell wall biosynthesis|nr:glycosyltransferase family 2 protein [Chitinophagaceae bacterium]
MPAAINHKDVFVVVPAYNEQTVIRDVVSELVDIGYTVVVVDDGSKTSPEPFLKGLPVYFLQHEINMGQGAALQTGIEFAREHHASYIITFDGDGQHNADDIKKLLEPLQTNEADFTLGSRFLKGAAHNMSGARKQTLQIAKFINYIFTGMRLTDAYNGMRALNPKASALVNIRENGMAHATELLTFIKKNKLRFQEVPVNIRYTEYSKNKGLTVWNGFRIFFDILLNKIFG